MEQNKERDAFDAWWDRDGHRRTDRDEGWIAWQACASHYEDARAMVASQSAEPVALTDGNKSDLAAEVESRCRLIPDCSFYYAARFAIDACIDAIARSATPPAATGAQGLTERFERIKRLALDAGASTALPVPQSLRKIVRECLDGVSSIAQAAPAPSASPAALTDEQTRAQLESLARHSYGGRFPVYMSGADARAILAAQPAAPAPVDRPFKRYAALDAAMDQASKQMDRLDAYLDENSHAAAADNAAVDAFAVHMKEKLATARKKGRGGWQQCTPEDLSGMLREHVEKGDPRDVANFCMFLHALGHGIQRVDRQGVALSDEEIKTIWLNNGGSLNGNNYHAFARAILSRASSSQGVALSEDAAFENWRNEQKRYATRDVWRAACAWQRASSSRAPSEPDYRARYDACIGMLADISDALGIPGDEAACANGHDLILAAINLASSSRAEVETASFEIRVDGMRMAATGGPRERALSEAQRYFSQYADEGEVVELVEVIMLAAAEAPNAEKGE